MATALSPQWRNYFRSAAAHSTVIVDGLGQSEPAGPFAWRRRPRAVLREWITTPQFDLVDAEHNAYAHLAAPVIHRRRVMFVKPDFWVLIDDITGAGRHAVDCSFQFAPLAVELSGDRCRVETERGSVLWIMPFASAPLETRDPKRRGAADSRLDLRSLRTQTAVSRARLLGRRRAANAIDYRAVSDARSSRSRAGC